MKFNIEKLNAIIADESEVKLSDKEINAATKSYRHSTSMKGKTPWNFGKSASEETKAKLSESRKGKATWNKGKSMSAEIVEANRQGQLGKKHSEETKALMSTQRKGKKKPPKTEEAKANLSAALKGRPAWNKGVKQTEEVKLKLSSAKIGKKWYTNGENAIQAFECPKGWRLGRK